MPPPRTWRDGNRHPAREAPASETYSSSEEEAEEAEEEAPEGDATVRLGAPPPSGRVAKKSSAPPPPPAAAASTLPPTAVPVAGLGAPPGPPPLPASPGQPTTIYPDGTAQQGLYTATGQFIGYFRVPVGVPMVIFPRVPAEANGDASAAASPGPAASTAAVEPTAVKAEPTEKSRHPKDKGDAKRAKEGRERPEKESANKKDKRDRDPKKDKKDRDPKKEKKDRDNQKEKKETRVPEPKAYPLKKDRGYGRVKEEPKEPRERGSPSFEREFLPQARAKSGAWKPYNDTWFDYDGRDERLYPEEARRRRGGPPAPRTPPRGRTPGRRPPFNPYEGDEEEESGASGSAGPGPAFDSSQSPMSAPPREPPGRLPGPARGLQAPYPAEAPGKKQRERRKYAVRRDRGSDSRASPEKKRPRKTAKSEESPPLPPPATPPPKPSPTSPADRRDRMHAPAQRAEPLRAAQAAPAKAPSRPASNRSHGKASAGSQGMPRDGAPVKAGGPPLPPPLSDRIILQKQGVTDRDPLEALAGGDEHHSRLLARKPRALQQSVPFGFTGVHPLDVDPEVTELLVGLVEPVDVGPHGLAAAALSKRLSAELEEISKAMEVLTVTAQKLKSFTQGRRWTDGRLPCPRDGAREGGYEEPPPDEQAYDDQYDEYYDAAEGQAEEDGQGQETHESYFVWMTTLEEWIPPQVSQVLTNAPETAAGLMIVDTACQKTCIGRKAYLAHCATLRPFGLSCKWLPESERFKFGAGKPAMSSASLAIPAGIDGRPMVLVASLLAAEIPLLASLKMLKQLGAVLDLPSEKAFLGSLQIEVPLHVTLGGHLAICVTSFPVDGLPCDLDETRLEETWDVASHRGRKKLTEALDYYKPLVLAVRLTSSPAHSDPEVSKAALKALEKQQRRGHYWTLIAPPDHTVWSNQNVSRLLSSSHAHVTQAEATPAGLAHRVRRVVRELEPTRFRREKQRPLRTPACGTWDRVSTKPPFHETYYLDYVQDDREWRGVMDQVEQVFRTSASPQITLTPGHEIWKRISEMIPWRIERVQLAKAPKARRFPRDIPFTHRATVLLYNDDEVACESDDVANIAFPHQRFPKPVRYAICVYGDAPEDPTDVPAPPQPTGTPPVDPDVPPEEVHGADITFPNCKAPREIKRAVARLHVNLGHPSSADLVRMLAQNGAVTPEAVSAAKALTCASCLRMRGNAPPRPSRLVDRFVGQLGDCVQMDIFYSRTVDGTNYPLLGIVDEATNLQQVCVLKDRNPKTVVEAFRTTWARPFGFPHKVTLDQDGAFMGDFWTYLVDNSTEVDYVPAEAHHRLGKAERCNAVYREVLNRVVDSMAAATPEDLEMAVDATTHAINSMPRSRGLSAYAIVFGRIPRVPAELLTDDSSLAANIPLEEHNRHTIVYRAEAQKAAAQVNVDISPGAKCAVWRSQLRGKGPRKRGGYVIGRLVTFDGHCAWVQLGTQTVKVDRNQLRPAYGFEAWSPTDEDIKALKNAEANLLSGEVEDWQGEAPPDDEPLFPELEFPPEPSEEQVQSALDGTDGADLAALADTAAASAASAPPLPPPAYSPPASEVPLQDDSEMALSSQATLICESGEVPEVFASEHREPPIQGAEDDGVEDCHPSWKVCYVGDQKQLANVNKMTRKEVKALNREIPWREILKQPRVVFDKYVEAARKEHEQWGTWAPVRPLSDKEANEVLKDPLLRTRVLKSRACYRDKACGQGALQAKCRVVVLGHRDPDLHAISRDAPTPTRLTEHILLAVYISGRNRSFLRNRRVWRLWSADATTAFLQGRQNEGERPNRLFMMSPRDPILEKAGAFPATIYEVTGSVYGLANAPRLWSLEVGKRLLAAGFRPHALDRMCFLHYDKEGCLDCIALVYVDDFLVTYADHFDLTVLTRLFKWGKTSFDTDVITFKGKQLRTVKENGVFVLRVTQSEYIRTLAPGKVTRQRGREDPKLTEAELSEFRSVCGALQWLVGQTRPDGAATVSLMNRGNDSTLSELKQLYALSEYFARTHSDGLVFHGIPINEHSTIVSYGDCSWANAQEYKSQEGLLVCLTTPDALTGNAPAVLLDWKSTRTPRVVRSTLAGEAYAADDSIDRGVLANQMFSEIIFGCEANPVTNLKTLRHCHATDCKSLYDAAIAANFNTEEKRVGLTIRAVQETIAPQDMRWVPTTAMWADGLTKVSDSLRETFRNWLRQPTVQLRSDA
ncbi:RE2 [Symbiodinium sp. CCMP2592]|nr:RE2 [Symbiodinium sp. CCMP2592]